MEAQPQTIKDEGAGADRGLGQDADDGGMGLRSLEGVPERGVVVEKRLDIQHPGSNSSTNLNVRAIEKTHLPSRTTGFFGL